MAAAESTTPRTQWAILVGVEQYESAPDLRFTVNDVKRMSDTLINRGGFQRQHVLEMTDQQPTRELQPRKNELEQRLTEWLEKPEPGDSVIVYFSGHGFRDAEGKLYLAPLDVDPRNPASTGVAVEWFRNRLAACRAEFKLLILDSCHAGTEKGDQHDHVDPQEIGNHFESLERVVTLASSKATEKSLIWDSKQQSLFSYWLVQGLRGQADRDPDGTIDIHELYEFVFDNVKRTAQLRFNRPQTPVRIVRSDIAGVPRVVALKPRSLKATLADMAEQLAQALADRKLSKVGVLEFLAQSQTGDEQLGGNFGLLGKSCADELERQLQQRTSAGFQVVDRRRLQEVLREQQFTPASLGSTQKLASLSKSLNGAPVLAIGTLLGRDGRLLRLQCKLQQTEDDIDLGVSVGGLVQLSDSDWAMLGRSVIVRGEDRRPAAVASSPMPDDTVIERLDQRVQTTSSHPLQDASFPFKVSLRIDGKERAGEFRGNDYLIPVRKGEKYQIVTENRSGDVAVMRLLVDGLNTLPERDPQDAKGIQGETWAKRVNLNEARHWILDPKDSALNGGAPRWVISGFATATGPQGKLREFLIVDAQESLAVRQQFAQDVGLITAAFYKPLSKPRGAIGTGAGAEISVNLVEQSGIAAGNLMGVVHLRYVDAETLKVTNK